MQITVRCLSMGLVLVALATLLAQQPPTTSSQDADLILAAVSRDQYMFSGGIGAGKRTVPGTVVVEPLAHITPSGEWKSLGCTPGSGQGCREFAQEYLKKPHVYTVVSADGRGATIHAAPTTLSECFDYSGRGTYSGATLANSAIAASSDEFFAESAPLQDLDKAQSREARGALATFIPKKLDSTQHLRFLPVQLEGQNLLVIQRASSDMAELDGRLMFIFAIGTIDQGRFRVLHWTESKAPEEERVLGTIRLKSGRDFLVTTVNDPESHSFRVYGIRDGRLTLIYSGGGSSC